MRIAFLPDGTTPNAMYRSIGPMRELTRRGHETRMLTPENRATWPDALRWCELLHIHRVCDGGVVELARAAKAAGAAVVWDDDDDVTRVSKRVARAGDPTGLVGTRRLAARARLFRTVDLVTTPSERLAEAFRAGGAPEVLVIENYILDEYRGDRAARFGELTIGWVAGSEHQLDAESLDVPGVLTRLLSEHPGLHVATLGLDLRIASERYRCIPPVIFPELLGHVAAFDIGIAPLSPDVEINHTRSSIKVKEYAATGVPWLASPIGPYADLGEKQGGRLVADDAWSAELDALIRSPRTRRRLAKRAAKWGRNQTVARNAGEWEQALAHAAAQNAAA